MIYWDAGKGWCNREPFVTLLAGYTFGPNYLMKRKSADEYVLAYIKNGYGTLLYNKKVYNLSNGDAFILHANSCHTYYSDENKPFQFLWFNCTGMLLPLLLQAYGLEQRIIIPQYGNSSLFQQFHAICRSYADPQEVNRRSALQFHKIAASFAEHIRHTELGASLPYQIKRYLDDHLNQALSLKELAQQMGYSPAYIGRCFKSAYGQTPYQYLLSEKLEASQKLLSQTPIKVRQVASLFGFTDEFHFSNAFYKHFGYRPAYENRHYACEKKK